jgi:hypothetical protein
MKFRVPGSMFRVLLASVAAVGALASLAAQQPPAVPDITGSWERMGFGGRGGAAVDKTLIPPQNPQPALKPEARKERDARVQAAREADAKGEPLATNATLCLPEGMPAMMGATFPMEILQSRGQVTIIAEAYNQVRRILLDRPQKALADVDPSFYGHSVGRWENGVLLVDTIGVKETVRFQNAPHSPQMRIRERIRLVAPDVLWDEITIEDPVTLEKPWTITNAYRRMPNYTLLEYVCEDNREYADEQGKQKIRLK